MDALFRDKNSSRGFAADRPNNAGDLNALLLDHGSKFL